MISKLSTFFRLSPQRKVLVLQAFGLSFYTCILFTFFNRRAGFGKETGTLPVNWMPGTGIKTAQKTADITAAIQIVNKYVPWKNVCRHQAYQAKLLCSYHRIPCLVYIGFKKDKETNEIQAHAWTVANGRIITGFCDPDEYTIQSIYSNKWH